MKKYWSRFSVFWDVILFLPLAPQNRCVFHLLCLLFNQPSAEQGHSKCKEDICASLSHTKNSAKKKREDTMWKKHTSIIEKLFGKSWEINFIFFQVFQFGGFFSEGVRRKVSFKTWYSLAPSYTNLIWTRLVKIYHLEKCSCWNWIIKNICLYTTILYAHHV